MAVINAEIVERTRQTIEAIKSEIRPAAIYLFGSHVNGTSDRWSDIDIALFVDDIESWDIWRRIDFIVSVQNRFGFDIELHFFSSESLTNPEPGSFADEIIRHGYRLI